MLDTPILGLEPLLVTRQFRNYLQSAHQAFQLLEHLYPLCGLGCIKLISMTRPSTEVWYLHVLPICESRFFVQSFKLCTALTQKCPSSVLGLAHLLYTYSLPFSATVPPGINELGRYLAFIQDLESLRC